jgi:ribosomal protein L25 (general stress protein Ctc)
MSRPLLYENKLTPVTISLDYEMFHQYKTIQEQRNSNASAGIRELIKNCVMQDKDNNPARQEMQHLTIPNF